MISADTAALVERVEQWLLTPTLICRTGAALGQVAGAIDVFGQPRYWYPEITGYYLSWTARVYQRVPRATIELLARGIERSAEQFAPPFARSPAEIKPTDDYSRSSYFFDIAMYYRGVIEFSSAISIALSADVQRALDRWVGYFVTSNGAVLATFDGDVKADRWSTRMGPHQAKACGHLVRAASLINASPPWLTAVARCYDQLAAVTPDHSYPSHPLAYWVEGCLVRRHSVPDFAMLFSRWVLDHGVSEVIGSGVYRVDALAQCLRAAIYAAVTSANDSNSSRCHRIASQLSRAIAMDGAVPFDARNLTQGGNTWCALFAWQALSMFDHWQQGHLVAIDPPDVWI